MTFIYSKLYMFLKKVIDIIYISIRWWLSKVSAANKFRILFFTAAAANYRKFLLSIQPNPKKNFFIVLGGGAIYILQFKLGLGIFIKLIIACSLLVVNFILIFPINELMIFFISINYMFNLGDFLNYIRNLEIINSFLKRIDVKLKFLNEINWKKYSSLKRFFFNTIIILSTGTLFFSLYKNGLTSLSSYHISFFIFVFLVFLYFIVIKNYYKYSVVKHRVFKVYLILKKKFVIIVVDKVLYFLSMKST